MNTLTHLVKYLSGSSWMDINRQYYYQASWRGMALAGLLGGCWGGLPGLLAGLLGLLGGHGCSSPGARLLHADAPPAPPAPPCRRAQATSGGPKQYARGKLAYRGSTLVPSTPGATMVTDEQLQGAAPAGAGSLRRVLGPARSAAPPAAPCPDRTAPLPTAARTPLSPAATMSQLIAQRQLPLDAAQGMFLVLTSKELGASKEGQQFCRDICGYHNRCARGAGARSCSAGLAAALGRPRGGPGEAQGGGAGRGAPAFDRLAAPGLRRVWKAAG
jgi:hypothetical protein